MPQVGPQSAAIDAVSIEEVLYGGAAFGGKTDYLLADFLQDVPTYQAAWRGVLFRRTMGEMDDIIARSLELYPRTGAFYNSGKFIWRWSNGASLRFRYLERDVHRLRYQGAAFTWIGWDELTQWATEIAYRYLRGRLRSAHNVPTKRIRSTANPGGPGHHWVKNYFIAPAPGGFVVLFDSVTGNHRVFIPSKLSDNVIGMRNDPGYVGRLRGLGSATLVKAMLDGDWDIVEGAFFDCWSGVQHVIKPFAVPKNWARFRSMDWGSASPFAVHWWAVVQDDYRLPDGRTLPRGALVCYREWYGTRDPASSSMTGLKLFSDAVGRKIVEMEKDDPPLSGAVLDPSAFAVDGGPPISEGLNKELIKGRAMPFRPADNTRVSERGSKDKRGPMSGWNQVRGRMIGTASIKEDGTIDWSSGRPMVYCFDTCVAAIRTIPVLQHDTAKPEDLDTKSDDHAADSWRYGMNSRPWLRAEVQEEPASDAYSTEHEDHGIGSDSFNAI